MPEPSSCHLGGVRLIAPWRDVSSNLPSRRGILNHSGSKLLERSRHFETRIASQEAQISLLSKNGYTDGQLVEHNDKLNRYRKELHDRKQPMP
jgi:hypothetical protein